jgi:hypothetical protein
MLAGKRPQSGHFPRIFNAWGERLTPRPASFMRSPLAVQYFATAGVGGGLVVGLMPKP